MSETNQETVEAAPAAPAAQPNLPPTITEVEPKLIKLDLYEMFQQVQKLRDEGVSEETVREAFNELMAESQGQFRKPMRRIIKTADSAPVMTQAEINKMYEDALKRPESKVMSEDMLLLTQEIDRVLARKNEYAAAKKPRVTLKMLTYRAIYYSLTKFLAVIVWVFNKAGIK